MTRQARRLAFAHSSSSYTRDDRPRDRVAGAGPGHEATGRVYLVSAAWRSRPRSSWPAVPGRERPPGKSKIVARWQSYHGGSLGALSITG